MSAFAEHLCDEELSIGSFVVSGGEWAAGIVIDSVAPCCPAYWAMKPRRCTNRSRRRREEGWEFWIFHTTPGRPATVNGGSLRSC